MDHLYAAASMGIGLIHTLLWASPALLVAGLVQLARRRRRAAQPADPAATQQTQATARAKASGHPSAPPRRLTPAERGHVISDLLTLLLGAGLQLSHPWEEDTRHLRVWGEDGEYVLVVGDYALTVVYMTNRGPERIGRFRSSCAAVRALRDHAARTLTH